MYFTQPAANRVGRLTPDGLFGGFTVSTPESRPTGIVAVPGGYIWVSLEGAGKVLRLEVFLRHGPAAAVSRPLGRAPFQIRVLKRHLLNVAQGDLKIRVVVKLAGKVVANRRYLLRGGR
jgi:hypothetical protein